MKRPQPDIGDVLRTAFIGSLGGCRKFKRLWGTEWVNGTEVMTRKQYYYPDSKRLAGFEKLFKFLGVYEDVKDSKPKGVKHAWFYLNKNKGPLDKDKSKAEPIVSETFIAENLNRMWWDSNDGERPENLTLTTTISIDADVNTAAVSDLIDLNATKPQQIQAIIDNYEELWSKCPIEQQGVGIINKGTVHDANLNVDVPDEDDLAPDDPWLATISRYALLDDGVPCTVKDLEIGLSQKARNKVNTLVVTIEIPYAAFNVTSPLVDRIAQDLVAPVALDQISMRYRNLQRMNNVRSIGNGFATYNTLRAMAFNEVEDDLEEDVLTRDYLLWEDEGTQAATYESVWVKDGKKWYLKADVFDDPKAYGLTYKKLHTYVFSILDTGYKKKKAKWYKKVIAVVVFIIVAVFTYNAALAAGASALVAAATAVVIASFAITLATLAFSIFGMESMATAFASVNRAIEPLVMVASIILIVNSVVNFAKKAAEQGIGEALKAVASNIIDDLTKGLADLASGTISVQAAKVLEQAIELYTLPQQIQLEKLAERNKDLKAEYDKFMEENSRESDVLQGFMRVYSSPATGDWSWYSGLYDMPYERGGGIMAMGNIQRTTKQALRKADYDMPVFENIRLI